MRLGKRPLRLPFILLTWVAGHSDIFTHHKNVVVGLYAGRSCYRFSGELSAYHVDAMLNMIISLCDVRNKYQYGTGRVKTLLFPIVCFELKHSEIYAADCKLRHGLFLHLLTLNKYYLKYAPLLMSNIYSYLTRVIWKIIVIKTMRYARKESYFAVRALHASVITVSQYDSVSYIGIY